MSESAFSGNKSGYQQSSGKLNQILARRTCLKQYEEQVRELGKVIPPGPQRIRGIAGSGKTRLLCYKAAYMHHYHPEWDIALVFNTESLYEEIRSQVDAACNDIDCTWDREKLQVMHAWGGRKNPGFYSRTMNAQGLWSLILDDIPRPYRKDGLPYACHCYLNERGGKIERPLYDAVLIDEGQDLVTDRTELLYEGRQPFYWFAYQALRPTSQEKPWLRRLIWAYDEYQTITTLKIPTSREIFGKDFDKKWTLTGKYPDGAGKSIILNTCYRNPGPIILASHAISMGLFRREGQIAGPTSKAAWQALGYEVEGDFRKNKGKVTLYRPEKYSKNPITEPNGDIPFNWLC